MTDDMLSLVEAVDTPGNPIRFRQVDVVSVEAGQTCTISVGSVSIAGVRYSIPPQPGGSAWVITDGSDVQIVHTLGGQSSHPAFHGSASVQSIPHNLWTTVTSWPTVTDPWGMESSGIVTIPADGVWAVQGVLDYDSTSSAKWSRILKDTTVLQRAAIGTDVSSTSALTSVWTGPLVKGHTVTVQANQQTGGNHSLQAYSMFSVTWLGLS